jgi:hypothetical protein
MNRGAFKFDRQDILVLHCIFSQTGLRREPSAQGQAEGKPWPSGPGVEGLTLSPFKRRMPSVEHCKTGPPPIMRLVCSGGE